MRNLASSNIKTMHEAAPGVAKLQHGLFAAILSFLETICAFLGALLAAAEDLFHRLHG